MRHMKRTRNTKNANDPPTNQPSDRPTHENNGAQENTIRLNISGDMLTLLHNIHIPYAFAVLSCSVFSFSAEAIFVS